MKKVAVWGAELPSVFTMPFGLSKKAEIWLRKEPVSSVPRKVVMTCTVTESHQVMCTAWLPKHAKNTLQAIVKD